MSIKLTEYILFSSKSFKIINETGRHINLIFYSKDEDITTNLPLQSDNMLKDTTRKYNFSDQSEIFVVASYYNQDKSVHDKVFRGRLSIGYTLTLKIEDFKFIKPSVKTKNVKENKVTNPIRKNVVDDEDTKNKLDDKEQDPNLPAEVEDLKVSNSALKSRDFKDDCFRK